MGKKTKIGKTRRDKYYHLAKEQGFRSRAAFKLVQLNKKYDFLSKAKCLIDLCAAPGGWLQVASKYMPVSSLIIGVDLVPIKPIRGCVTLAEDITTQKCRSALKKEMHGWKADVVIHDGAPNVGTNWLKDAYSQSELVLLATKLASEFLGPNGMYITKVFRSQDYNALLWVFNQLFSRVEVTKPQASRNTSAEIYVICKGFLAPKKIDPKMFDPKQVFGMIENQNEQKHKEALELLSNKKEVINRRRREGYEEGNYTFFKKCSVVDFINAKKPIISLATYNQIVFEPTDEPQEKSDANSDSEAEQESPEEVKEWCQKYLAHPKTTDEVKSLLTDLRVLSMGDFKILLKWRLQMVEFRDNEKAGDKSDESDEEVEKPVEKIKKPETEEEENARLLEHLQEMKEETERKKAKIEKKKKEKQQRVIERTGMKKLMPSEDVMDNVQDKDLFSLNEISSLQQLEANLSEKNIATLYDNAVDGVMEDSGDEPDLYEDESDSVVDSDSEDDYIERLNRNISDMYEEYKMAKGKRVKNIVESRRKLAKFTDAKEKEDIWNEATTVPEIEEDVKLPNLSKEFYMEDEGSDADNESDLEDSGAESDSDAGSDAGGEDDVYMSDDEGELQGKKNPLLVDFKPKLSKSQKSDMWFNQPVFKELEKIESKKRKRDENKEAVKNKGRANKRLMVEDSDLEETDSDMSDDESESDYENMTPSKEIAKADEGFTTVPKDMLDPEKRNIALALGTMMLRKKQRNELLDSAYNRYAFNDEELPDWFLEEERQHMKPQLPVTKEVVQKIKDKFQEINARPIKKVAEAKARKKRRMLKRMEKAKKTATAISMSSDLTSKDKSKAIEKVFKKTQGKTKTGKVSVVAKKGGNKNVNTKKYKIVDRRMKKDDRKSKNDKSKKKGGGFKKPNGDSKNRRNK